MTWAALSIKQRPELEYLVAIPNGGARHIAVAAKLKAEGVKKGFPDLQMNLARSGYNGLFIELKNRDGKTSPEQKDWLERLMRAGNKAVVCKGWIDAQQTIIDYLDGTTNDNRIQ